MFSKRKNNAGRILLQVTTEDICRKTYKIFLIQVPNRMKETLLTAIKEYIKVSITIYSDCWRGNDTCKLTRTRYTHGTVKHTHNFTPYSKYGTSLGLR